MYYYNARYYDPQMGAFISPDSIIPDPGNPFAYNRYLYTFGNPLKYTDPSGHCPVCIVAILVGAAFLMENSTAEGPAGGYADMPDNANGLAGTGLIAAGLGGWAGFSLFGSATSAACADGNCTNEAESVTNTAPKLGQLRQVGQNVWESTAGLRYGIRTATETRVQHVLAHTSDNMKKDTQGVFTVGRSQVLPLLDEAWQLVQQKSPRVIYSDISEKVGDYSVYMIDMGRNIGYVGGKIGAQQGNPTTQILRLVMDVGSEVISAYPFIPQP